MLGGRFANREDSVHRGLWMAVDSVCARLCAAVLVSCWAARAGDSTTARPRSQRTVKRTYQPHRKSRLRTHGFRERMKTANGRKVINNRRRKGRARLGVGVYKK